jgi:hypothetical protein
LLRVTETDVLLYCEQRIHQNAAHACVILLRGGML